MTDTKKKVVSGFKWTFYSTIFKSVLQLIQIIILARLLNPADFGLMAIAQVIIFFAQLFVDLGISNSIIHYKDSNKLELSSLFWLNILLSFFLFLGLNISRKFISGFYSDLELDRIILVISFSYLIIPIGQIYIALLKKELLFDKLSKIEMVARIIGFCISILWAFLYRNVYALVLGNLIFIITNTFLVFLNGIKYFKPLFRMRILDVKKYLIFGLYQTGDRLTTFFASEFDVLIIGRILGTDILGIYNLSKTLVNRIHTLINPIFTKVSFPLFSKYQDNLDKVKRIYLKMINLLTSINLPIYIIIFLYADVFVKLFLGQEWEAKAVLIVKMFALINTLRSINNPSGSLIIALGKPDISFTWNIIRLCFLSLSIYLGSQYGISGVMFAILGFEITAFIPTWYMLIYRCSKISLLNYMKSIAVPTLINVFLATIYIIIGLNIDNRLISITLFILSFLIMNFIFTINFNNILLEEFRKIKFLNFFISRIKWIQIKK